MTSEAFWEVDDTTGEVTDLKSYRKPGSEISPSRPAKGERDLV